MAGFPGDHAAIGGRTGRGDGEARRSLAWVLGALAVPNFRRFFLGQAISQLGDRLVPVALTFAVLGQTHSVTDLSIVLTTQSVAQLAFFLAGGVIADRVPRRDLMLWSDAAQMISTGALGVLLVTGHPAVGVIPAAAAVQGVSEAMFLPASSGIVPALVGREQLQQANALRQVAGAATGIAGPAIAGVLIATIGPGWAIIGDSVTFIASIVSLARLQLDHIPRPRRSAWWTELRAGWAAFRERTWVWAITAGAAIFNFSGLRTDVGERCPQQRRGRISVTQRADGQMQSEGCGTSVQGVGAVAGHHVVHVPDDIRRV